jgi:hypothetical protein
VQALKAERPGLTGREQKENSPVWTTEIASPTIRSSWVRIARGEPCGPRNGRQNRLQANEVDRFTATSPCPLPGRTYQPSAFLKVASGSKLSSKTYQPERTLLARPDPQQILSAVAGGLSALRVDGLRSHQREQGGGGHSVMAVLCDGETVIELARDYSIALLARALDPVRASR